MNSDNSVTVTVSFLQQTGYAQVAIIDGWRCAFGVAAPRLWNSLPACVTSAKTLSTFKNI